MRQLEMETRSVAGDRERFSPEEASLHQFKAILVCQKKETFPLLAAPLILMGCGKLV